MSLIGRANQHPEVQVSSCGRNGGVILRSRLFVGLKPVTSALTAFGDEESPAPTPPTHRDLTTST